jgi:hypothetical protein
MVPELSVQTRGGPGGGTAPAGDLADLRRVNVELNEGFTDPRRPLAASVPVDATTSTVVAPANSAARGLVAALGLVVAGGIGLVVIGRSGGDRGVVADAGAVVVADAGAVVVDAGAVVVADAGAVVVDAGAVDAGTGSTSATRPVTTPPPTTTTPRAPPPTSTAPTTATPTPSAPPPAPPVSSPTTTTPVPTPAPPPESKAEPPPVPNAQRRAQLPTPALVAEALACPGVPAAMKALLTSSSGEEASRRTIALKQLGVHCP